MLVHSITDWDDAYANMTNIPAGEKYPEAWARKADAFRKGSVQAVTDIAYGPSNRNRYDLFHPQGESRGLLVIIHGGYWMRFDKDHFSQLAAGPLDRGWAVAMPSYDLCPQVRISDITLQIARAIENGAGRVSGPIRLAGHSAGGHLASRMVCANSPLSQAVLSRIEKTMSISGVHDLRPLLRLQINEVLRLDAAEATAESPALLTPVDGEEVICWVGAGERAEFLRNNALLANIWRGLGARTACVEEPDRHHFNVIEGLEKPDSPITVALAS